MSEEKWPVGVVDPLVTERGDVTEFVLDFIVSGRSISRNKEEPRRFCVPAAKAEFELIGARFSRLCDDLIPLLPNEVAPLSLMLFVFEATDVADFNVVPRLFSWLISSTKFFLYTSKGIQG
jgi:hypothetical protein